MIRRASSMIRTMISAWTPKAARQPRVVVIRPPSSGPAAAPIPPMALIAPKALARLVIWVNSRVVRMYTGGMSSAVPTPSRMEFPMISTVRFGDTALITAPIPNRARPAVRQRVRPYRSVSFPPGIINAAITNRNRVIATCTPCTVVFRSVLMSLIITFMLEPA